LIELPATGDGDTLAVLVSGDGGWAGIDRSVAEVLAGDGISVVGLDSLRYFWHARTPEGAARDLGRVIEHYASAWHRDRILLIGYSRGADVLPFMLNRLDAVQRKHIALLALIGSEQTTEFEFRLSDWLPGEREARHKVLPEVDAIKETRVLCIYGADEVHSICPQLDRRRFEVLRLPGGHHLNGDYKRLAESIARAAR